MVLLLGAALIVAGVFLFAVELIHPGALLLIPGSVLLVAGTLALLFDESVILSLPGIVIIVVGVLIATYVQILYYRRVAPVHRPMATTPSGLTGESGIVISNVVPDSLSGKVRVGSEIWSARSNQPIPAGTRVRVVAGEGVAVVVVPAEERSAS